MNDDIFIRKIEDVFRLLEKYHSARFSRFLDEQEQAKLRQEGILGGVLFGGYPLAERKMFGAFPDWQEPCEEEFPIKILRITKKYEKEINHRNYLGTILSLGIERDMIGDILVDDKGASVFVSRDIAEFIKDNIKKVSGVGVDISEVDIKSLKIPQKQFELMDIIAASMRIDACVAALLNVSRKDAKNLILSGKVMVNHLEPKSEDTKITEGDLLSVRGFGRAEIYEIGNKTRSDRIHITVKKYI